MGCDIHAYIEYSDFTDRDGEPYWQCFAAGFGSRDYTMFGVLAGVRDASMQLFEPKGLPEGPLSMDVQRSAYLVVNDQYADDEGYCSQEQAERWDGGLLELPHSGGIWTPHPDMHSHSWLTTQELAQAIAHYISVSRHGPYNVEWDATYAAMRAFDDRGFKTRLVFWFDN